MNNSPPKPKRRWYQFSMRMLILVLVVASMVFGWISIRMERARKNQHRIAELEIAIESAVAQIEKLSGRVSYEFVQRRTDSWLEAWFNDPGSPNNPVRVLSVSYVHPASTSVNGAGLEHLARLSHLEYLYLTNANDAVLAHLRGLMNLRVLQLNASNVTDDGLKHLEGLTNLVSLDAQSTSITDVGLQHLRDLTSLEGLDLRSTNVTTEGIKNLQQALPNCEIRH